MSLMDSIRSQMKTPFAESEDDMDLALEAEFERALEGEEDPELSEEDIEAILNGDDDIDDIDPDPYDDEGEEACKESFSLSDAGNDSEDDEDIDDIDFDEDPEGDDEILSDEDDFDDDDFDDEIGEESVTDHVAESRLVLACEQLIAACETVDYKYQMDKNVNVKPAVEDDDEDKDDDDDDECDDEECEKKHKSKDDDEDSEDDKDEKDDDKDDDDDEEEEEDEDKKSDDDDEESEDETADDAEESASLDAILDDLLNSPT